MTETHRYVVRPMTRIFDTRHEAVGFAAIRDRKYNYHRLNQTADRISVTVETYAVEEEP